jgi:GNAT superfamily N-acetyltransferase
LRRDEAIRVRRAEPADGPRILELDRELARFENLKGPDEEEGARLLRWIFEDRRFEALVAEREERIVGVALYFFYPTSFRARLALYLEDIVIAESARSSGVGARMMEALAREAAEAGCARMDWAVLPWNGGAVRFYERLGARPMEEWDRYYLSEEEIRRLARRT